MMSVAAVPQGARARRHRRRADRLRRSSRPCQPHAPDPGHRHRDRPRARHRPGRGVRHLRRLRRLLPRRRAGLRHGPRPAAPSYVLVIGVERLSDITDLDDRGTAFIFADGAGAAVVGPSDDARHRPGRLGLRRRAVRPDPAARGLARRGRLRAPRDAAPDDAGQPGLPLGVVRDGQDRPAGPRPRRHHRRRPRRLRAPPGQHAHHRRDGARR